MHVQGGMHMHVYAPAASANMPKKYYVWHVGVLEPHAAGHGSASRVIRGGGSDELGSTVPLLGSQWRDPLAMLRARPELSSMAALVDAVPGMADAMNNDVLMSTFFFPTNDVSGCSTWRARCATGAHACAKHNVVTWCTYGVYLQAFRDVINAADIGLEQMLGDTQSVSTLALYHVVDSEVRRPQWT